MFNAAAACLLLLLHLSCCVPLTSPPPLAPSLPVPAEYGSTSSTAKITEALDLEATLQAEYLAEGAQAIMAVGDEDIESGYAQVRACLCACVLHEGLLSRQRAARLCKLGCMAGAGSMLFSVPLGAKLNHADCCAPLSSRCCVARRRMVMTRARRAAAAAARPGCVP